MAKMTIRNTTKSPRGFYNEKGVVVTVAPGATAEADLEEAPIGFKKMTKAELDALAKDAAEGNKE